MERTVLLLAISMALMSCTKMKSVLGDPADRTEAADTTEAVRQPAEADIDPEFSVDAEAEAGEQPTWDGTEDEDDGYAPIKVAYSGERPNIVDFAQAYLKHMSGAEGIGPVQATLDRHLRNEQIGEEAFVLDVRNGYIKFREEHGAAASATEMCYWNCADGKHKVFAVNRGYWENGKPVGTQLTGLTFYKYTNATRTMKLDYDVADLSTPFLRAYPDGNVQGGTEGLETPVYYLPRAGKNIKMDTGLPVDGCRKAELQWNGATFDVKFIQ